MALLGGKKLSMGNHRISLPKTIIVPAGIVLKEAPESTTRAGVWYEYIIEIGNNEVAYLTLPDSAVRALTVLPPTVTIA